MAGLSVLPQQRAGLYRGSGHTQGIGDLEYFAELRNAPSSDELSRLGTKVAGPGIYYNPTMESRADYYQQGVNPEAQQAFRAAEGQFPTLNTAYTGMGVSVPAVQAHEFRHAGRQYILDNFTRQQMFDRWGKEGGDIYDILRFRNEGAVEAFDRPQDPAGSLGTMAETLEANMRPEWTDVLQRRMGGIASDIMYDLGVPRRSKPLGGK